MANANDSVQELMKIDGAVVCAIVDGSSGMAVATAGSGVNIDAAAAGNTEVVKAKLKTMASLGIKDSIEDILITLGNQFHIIRPMAKRNTVFVYLVLDKAKANLAMSRLKVADIESTLSI